MDLVQRFVRLQSGLPPYGQNVEASALSEDTVENAPLDQWHAQEAGTAMQFIKRAGTGS